MPADFYITFGGAHAQRGVDEPKLGDQVEYTVFGTIRSDTSTIRDDGETRVTYKVDVEAAWPKGSPRPELSSQGALINQDGEPVGELINTGADE
jgi:hypothetical protein